MEDVPAVGHLYHLCAHYRTETYHAVSVGCSVFLVVGGQIDGAGLLFFDYYVFA